MLVLVSPQAAVSYVGFADQWFAYSLGGCHIPWSLGLGLRADFGACDCPWHSLIQITAGRLRLGTPPDFVLGELFISVGERIRI